MNTSSDFPPPDPVRDPERLLRAGLRRTTDDFEARFDALQRSLGKETAPRTAWPGWFALRHRPRAWWTAFGIGAAALVMVAVMIMRPLAPPDGPAGDVAAFADVFALDDALRPALPLADSETLHAVLLIPIQPGDRS
ncbi:MAG TPA: hypothetical protein VGD81_10745 [Opitutaceae bacterium]